MRSAATFPLVVASLIGSASLPECAKAQSNPYALDRLFLDPSNSIPFNEVLSFNSATAVDNFFGVSSAEATLATDFYSGYTGNSADMLFDRFVPGGGRARLYGADISGVTLAQLRAVNGTLSLTSEGYTFNASINLASATSFTTAARLIQSALAAVRPTVATTTGSSIAPASASFTGSIQGGLMHVTSVSGGSIVIGGVLTSANGYEGGQIVAQSSGTPGGAGVYNVWYASSGPRGVIAPPGTALAETYGILTIGTVASGAVAVGQEATGHGVASNDEIRANISGAGSGSKWVVGLAQTVTSETVKMKAAPLQVTYHHVTGATANSGELWINNSQPVIGVTGDTGKLFDEDDGDASLPSTMSYASGKAAFELGLTKSAGAYNSTPGQATTSPSAWMNNVVNIVEKENIGFATFQTTYDPKDATPPEVRSALEKWAQSSGGNYSYLKGWSANTPPIVGSAIQLAGAPAPAVPEPDTWVMLIVGFAGLGFAGYRQDDRLHSGVLS